MRNKRTKSGSNMMNARRASDADVAIGERIRARRNQIQMSQDELGQALGVSFQQIQKYEKGVNRLSSGRLVELAATLQCSAADLIGGVEKASAKSTPFSLRRLEGRRCNHQRDDKNLKPSTPAASHQPH